VLTYRGIIAIIITVVIVAVVIVAVLTVIICFKCFDSMKKKSREQTHSEYVVVFEIAF